MTTFGRTVGHDFPYTLAGAIRANPVDAFVLPDVEMRTGGL